MKFPLVGPHTVNEEPSTTVLAVLSEEEVVASCRNADVVVGSLFETLSMKSLSASLLRVLLLHFLSPVSDRDIVFFFRCRFLTVEEEVLR